MIWAAHARFLDSKHYTLLQQPTFPPSCKRNMYYTLSKLCPPPHPMLDFLVSRLFLVRHNSTHDSGCGSSYRVPTTPLSLILGMFHLQKGSFQTQFIEHMYHHSFLLICAVTNKSYTKLSSLYTHSLHIDRSSIILPAFEKMTPTILL